MILYPDFRYEQANIRIADVYAAWNVPERLCVIKKVPMDHQVVIQALWLAQLFCFDTSLGYYTQAIPQCWPKTELKKKSYLKGLNDQTYYVSQLPLHRDPFHIQWYKEKIYLQNEWDKIKPSVFTPWNNTLIDV